MMRKSSVFYETQFLSLAQALEGFGRIRFQTGNYEQLIQKTYDLLSAEFATKLLGDRSEFIERVKQTRNFLTHLGGPKKSEVVEEPKELFLLNQRLQAFLRCVMLIDLGISEDELREPILYQAHRWW